MTEHRTYKDLVMAHTKASKCKMIELTEITSDFVEEMKRHCPEKTEKFLKEVECTLDLYLSEEKAKYYVSQMTNVDGTKGQHWSVEETCAVADKMGVKLDGFWYHKYDWYYVMNMIWSDCYETTKGDLGMVVKLALDRLEDPDFPIPYAKAYAEWKESLC